jgi:hypothetical protein
MVTRKRIAIVVVAVTILGLLFCSLRPTEPEYEGKSLTTWLRSYEPDGEEMPAQVQHAIRQMGTNALPRLLEVLQRQPFVAKQRIYDFLNDKVGLDISDDVLVWQVRSVQALQALGPIAKPALPELTRLLHDPENSIMAAEILPYLGADAVPSLIGALSSTNSSIRQSGVWGLAYSGSNGEPAIQLLLETSLGRFRSDPRACGFYPGCRTDR